MKNFLFTIVVMGTLLVGCNKGGGNGNSGANGNSANSGSRVIQTITCIDQGSFFENLLTLTNAVRQEFGLNPLRISATLSDAAQFHSMDMATQNFFSHTSLDGSSVSDRAQRFGYTGLAGENIGAGYKSPEAVIQGWMNSPGHRENILRPEYTEIGLGFFNRSGSKYGTYWTQVFGIRVIDPADPVVSALPSTFSESCTLAQNNSDPIVLSGAPNFLVKSGPQGASTPEAKNWIALVAIGGLLQFLSRRSCS